MELHEILAHVDHTLLKQDATWEQIQTIVDEGMEYQTASVCIPASYVKQAAEYAGGRVKICTVIGFPNGYSTMASKCFEAADAVQNGADEIDMVVNIGWVKDGKYDEVLEEIKDVKAVSYTHLDVYKRQYQRQCPGGSSLCGGKFHRAEERHPV